MTQKSPSPKFAPAKYADHFTPQEFKFRWVDALVEVREAWLIRSVDHVARVLLRYLDQDGYGYPGIPEMTRAMRVSKRTVSRSLAALVEHGWLIVTDRTWDTNEYQAVLPEYGLELLLERHEKRSRSRTVEAWQAAASQILERSCALLGIAQDEWKGTKEWARVEGRTRQLLKRLGGPEVNTDYVVKLLTQEPPESGVFSPPGFLLKRLSQVSRLMPAACTQAASTDPDNPSSFADHRTLVQEIVSQTSRILVSRMAENESRDQQVAGPSS